MAIVAANVRRGRAKRGLSLERLARASGVSRSTLGQVELGRCAPSINVIWKIARALGLSLSEVVAEPGANLHAIVRASTARQATPHHGALVSRTLFSFERPREVEFHELRLGATAVEKADPRPPGTKENLVVVEGTLDLVIDGHRLRLAPGDAALFDADVPHEYRNDSDEPLLMHVVMTYAAQT
jgi:transcriptional regulator with XRE-family HTH domain